MASILITEDGSGVADANSFVSAVQARQYASLRGVTLPAVPGDGSQDPVETMLVNAGDYLNGKAYIGFLATYTQGLAWPRVFNWPYEGYKYLPMLEYWMFQEVSIDPSYYILPSKLLAAQSQLVIEQQNGIVLQPSTPGGIDGQFVTRQKVDVIETVYSEKLGTLATPTMPAVDALLRGLVVRGGGQAAIRAVRV